MNHPDMFKDIDSRVLQAIEQRSTLRWQICAGTALKDRVVDRALQRLRKQGKIEYASPVQGWKLKST